MGCVESKEAVTAHDVDAMPEGPDKETAKEKLRRREAEEKSSELKRHGITLPPEKLLTVDAEAPLNSA